MHKYFVENLYVKQVCNVELKRISFYLFSKALLCFCFNIKAVYVEARHKKVCTR